MEEVEMPVGEWHHVLGPSRLSRKERYSDGFRVIKGRHQNHHIAIA
jgi:hypothetical protein